MIQKRQFKESDRDFLVNTTLQSFLNGSSEIKKINKDSYLRAHNRTVNGLLDNCNCIVMCDSEDADLIYGFMIYDHLKDHDVLHYIYVRKNFRGKGIAGKMIDWGKSPNKILALSHLTDDFKPARLKNKYDNVHYNPFLRTDAYRRN